MKSLLMLMMILIVACGSEEDKKDKESRHDRDDHDLTIRLAERTVNGKLHTYLQLCEDSECHNALRERDGDEFYLPNNVIDERGDYRNTNERNVDRESRIDRRRARRRDNLPGQRNHHALGDRGLVGSSQHIGGHHHAPRVGVIFAHGGIRLSYSYNARTSHQTRATYRDGNSYRDHTTNRYQTGVRRSKRNDNDDYADAVGTVAERAELMRAITNDRRWEEREHSVQKLFVDGKTIAVNKEELRRLLDIVADYFNVEIDREVEDLLDRR